MRTPITFSGPSARAARYAVTAESTPPETPTTALAKPRRSISSRMKWTSHCSVERRVDVERGGRGSWPSRPHGHGQSVRRLGSTTASVACAIAGGRNARPSAARIVLERVRRRRRRHVVEVRARCGIIVSRSAMSGMSARARVTSARSTVAERIASSHSGARPRTSPFGPATQRAAREHLSAFAPDQVRQRDVDAVLVRDLANQPIPPADARRSGNVVRFGPESARRRRRAARTRSARRRARRSSPSCCATRPRKPAMPPDPRACRTPGHRVPRSTNRSSSNSPYVGRKTLRWTCAIARLAPAERDVHRAVVQLVVPDLVEADVTSTGRRSDAASR